MSDETLDPMHVLMLVPHYEPDLGPSAPLFTMLGVGLAKRGHKVTVITTVPHYPSGRVTHPYRSLKTCRSVENGVEVLRVPLPSLKRSSLPLRTMQFACYQLGATWAGRGQEFDVALVANPALWVWLPFAWLIRRRRMPALFAVFDVFPDVGVALDVFRNKRVIAAVSHLERFCLRNSAVVSILSDSFRPGLRALGVPDEKMAVTYGWVDTELIRPMPHANPFAREHGLADSFVVLYAGNLGLSQGLENVLAASEQLVSEKDIRFVLVGDGAGREALVQEAAERELSNIQFLPFQPRQRLPEVLATASVSLVQLRKGIGSDSLPSKIWSILASGRPILAAVDEGSEAWKLVTRAEAGLCVPPENPAELAKAVLALKNDPGLCERLGQNGRRWVERYNSPQAAAERHEALLADAMVRNERRDIR
jgi:colanic acid biosynthesis glycosyl transferase WcaI